MLSQQPLFHPKYCYPNAIPSITAHRELQRSLSDSALASSISMFLSISAFASRTNAFILRRKASLRRFGSSSTTKLKSKSLRILSKTLLIFPTSTLWCASKVVSKAFLIPISISRNVVPLATASPMILVRSRYDPLPLAISATLKAPLRDLAYLTEPPRLHTLAAWHPLDNRLQRR